MHILLLILIAACLGLCLSPCVEAKNAASSTQEVCGQYEHTWTREEIRVWKTLCKQGMYSGEPILSVSGQFIRDLILISKYREKLNPNGLAISDVRFTSFVDLSGLNIPVGLEFSSIDGSVQINLNGARILGSLVLANIEIRRLDIQDARITGDIRLLDTVKDITARNVKIEGTFELTQFSRLILTNAEIGRGLIVNVENPAIRMRVDAPYVKVGGLLWINTPEEAGDSPFVGISANFNNAHLSQDLVVLDSNITRLDLNEAEIGGSVQLSGNALQVLNASGVRISQQFVLRPSMRHNLTWRKGSSLNLSNARISRVSAPRAFSYWPDSIELRDAQFNSFVSQAVYPNIPGAPPLKSMPEPDWFVSWLGIATKDHFDPQPYQQIMDIASKSGQNDIHDAVGFAKKERERKLACTGSRFSWLTLDCAVLTFSRVVIGYGYQYWHTVIFVLVFVALGTIAFHFVPKEDRRGLRFGIAYSFDTFIPLIRLRELHYQIDISNWVRYYFYVHKLAGWVAGTFLVAGLGGFTK